MQNIIIQATATMATFHFHLEEIDKIISKFEAKPKLEILSRVNNQEKQNKPKIEQIFCQNDALAPFSDKQTTTGVTFMFSNLGM